MRVAYVAVVAVLAGGPAWAQRADDNAVKSAEDAFGTSIGTENIGLYRPVEVRGFSAIAREVACAKYRLDCRQAALGGARGAPIYGRSLPAQTRGPSRNSPGCGMLPRHINLPGSSQTHKSRP